MAEVLRILRKIEATLDRFAPLLDMYGGGMVGGIAARRARRAVSQNGQGQIPVP